MAFDLAAYLARIGIESLDGLSETEKLRKIHFNHSTHIPFEALDPYRGVEVSCMPEAVFDKLVTRRRGGYCFEQNCLICCALNAAGIKTYGVLARISRQGFGFGQMLHRVNLAEADGARWIVDVGYGGDCFVLPLRFELGLEQTDGRNEYRVVRHERVQYSVQIRQNGEFVDLLGFNDDPATDDDFAVSNYYTSCNPKSGFKLLLMISRQTENGKLTLFNLAGGRTVNGVTERFELKPEELNAFLRDEIGINMDGVDVVLHP